MKSEATHWMSLLNLNRIAMKTLIIILLSGVFAFSLNAQFYSDYDVRHNTRYNYRSYDSNSQYWRTNNANSNYGYLPIKVRKKVHKLERRIAEKRRCALEDGYLSRREARRIYELERDLNSLLYEYGSIRGYRSQRNNRICR